MVPVEEAGPWVGHALRGAADSLWNGAKQAADWAAASPISRLIQPSSSMFSPPPVHVPIAHRPGLSLGQDLALAGGERMSDYEGPSPQYANLMDASRDKVPQ